MPAVTTPAKKRTLGQMIRRLLLIDLFKGLALTFRYNARALYEPRDGGNPLQAIYTEQYPKEVAGVAERFRGRARAECRAHGLPRGQMGLRNLRSTDRPARRVRRR